MSSLESFTDTAPPADPDCWIISSLFCRMISSLLCIEFATRPSAEGPVTPVPHVVVAQSGHCIIRRSWTSLQVAEPSPKYWRFNYNYPFRYPIGEAREFDERSAIAETLESGPPARIALKEPAKGRVWFASTRRRCSALDLPTLLPVRLDHRAFLDHPVPELCGHASTLRSSGCYKEKSSSGSHFDVYRPHQ